MTKASTKSKFFHTEIWQTPVLTVEQFSKLDIAKKMEYLCLLAHLAPSTHNTQPWRFFLDETKETIDIFLDRNYVLPVSDVVGRQAIVSMGCCLENILVACEYYGIKPEVIFSKITKNEILPLVAAKQKSLHVKICSVNLSKSTTPKKNEISLVKAIFSRKAMRAEFDPKILVPKLIIDGLKSFFTDKKACLNFVTDPVRKMTLSEFQGQADSFVINSPKFSKELGNWLLPNETQSALGMPGIGFGLQDQQAKRMHLGLSGQGVLEPEDGLRFSLGGKMAIEKSPLICLLTIEKDEPLFWVLAGQKFQRMFLYLESKGFSVAVHAAIVEVSLINRIFAASLGTTQRLCVLFRTGKVKDKNNLSRPHSPRKPLEEIILNSQPIYK